MPEARILIGGTSVLLGVLPESDVPREPQPEPVPDLLSNGMVKVITARIDCSGTLALNPGRR